ncbi:hypothetical protein [Rhodopirellula bahusiensis]
MHPDEVQHNSNNVISEAQQRTLAQGGDFERRIGRADERLKQTMGGH